jgi:serine/threonine protein kinase
MDSLQADPFFSSLYIYESDLGKGAFGRVCKCTNKLTKEQVAVKIISKSGISKLRLSQLVSEVKILGQLNHPNIVKLHSFQESPQHFMIELELLSGGTLESRLSEGPLNDSDSARVMCEVLKAVNYLHKRNIIHRDIKPENIMFGSEDLQSVKLTDFGLSSQCRLNMGSDDNCGTALFMAPEQAKKRIYNSPVDVWSCGIVLYILITGQHPLHTPDDSVQSYFQKLNDCSWKFTQNFSESAKDLFLRMTKKSPIERYSAELALQHPWITRESGGRAPLTYLERLDSFNNSVKVRRIFNVSLVLASLLMMGRAEPAREEMPKIVMKFDMVSSQYHRRHTSIDYKSKNFSPMRKTHQRIGSMVRKNTVYL